MLRNSNSPVDCATFCAKWALDQFMFFAGAMVDIFGKAPVLSVKENVDRIA